MSFPDLTISQKRHYCDVFLHADPDHLTTAHYPEMKHFFSTELKSILHCRCFNHGHLPFAEELLDTEIGHLVEHVLLEYLCQEKLKLGHALAEYSGRTYWDWKKNAPGSFRIRIK